MPGKSEERRMVLVGVIGSAHGIRGEVKIRSFTDEPRSLVKYGTLYDSTGKRTFVPEVTGMAKGQLIARLPGVDDRNAAEALKGTELFIPREQLPELNEGEFYLEDLRGLELFTEDGEAFGTIKSIHNFGAGEVVEITLAGSKDSEMLPFSEDFFTEIDIPGNRAVVLLPEIIPADDEQDD